VGRVYREDADLLERQPTLLVSGSWLTVKEQMADLYARALASQGFTAITFDFRGFGQSGGEPRQAEIPEHKISDITAVARHVSRLSFVRPGGLGYLAICASAQYALAAIADGAEIASFVSVAGWYHDTETVAPFYGGTEGVALRLERGRAALNEYLRTGKSPVVPAYEAGNERAGMFFELDYYADPNRGAVTTWANEMAEMSWLYWLGFDGLSAAPGVKVPVLFVHSDGCVLPANVKAVRDRLAGPGELVWTEGGQTDFYDQQEQVSLAVSAAAEHFKKTLPA
jgi:pimeloyl-ACP methyl ester carboxylesterase